MVEVISDPTGDAAGAGPDLVALRAEKKDSVVVLEVVFAPGWQDTSFAIVSLDLDQDPTTGMYPPVYGMGSPDHDVGSELEVLVDIPNYYGSAMGVTQVPSAIVLDEFQGLVAVAPLTIGPDGALAELPLSDLEDDGNMNVCMLSYSDYATLSDGDFAPDAGHGVVGESGDALWLTETPESGTVPGESSVPVYVVADAAFLAAGTHEAILTITTNDPVTPVVTIDVRFEVEGTPADDPLPMPTALTLRAGPNPFTHTTSLTLGLPERGAVSVRIYDVLGRRVRVLADGTMEAGWHALAWDGRTELGRRMPSGLYVCRARTPAGAVTLRLVRTN
jgi:hypothetical protein